MDIGKNKPVLLFVHGLANYAPVWRYQLAELSKTYRCIAIDLPGNGFSSSGKYPYSTFFYAECVRLFAEAMHLQNIILIGHSMGGQIGLMLALRYPHLFDHLVLIAPAGIEIFSPAEQMMMQNLLSFGDFMYADESHLESTIRDSFEHQGKESRIIMDELKALLKNRSMQDWKSMCLSSIRGMLSDSMNRFLHQMEAKTLLLFGEKDRMIPNRMLHPHDSPKKIAQLGAALIPHCDMHLIPNAGHFVQIEKHAEVNLLIRNWIAQSVKSNIS